MNNFEKGIDDLISDRVRLGIDLQESKAREAKLITTLKTCRDLSSKPGFSDPKIWKATHEQIQDIVTATLKSLGIEGEG